MLQVIVVLSILAIFALTSLLSREAQPLPPRPVRGPVPDGARPSSAMGRGEPAGPGRYPGTPDRPSSAGPERTAPGRWSEPAPTARVAPGQRLAPDDGIVILDSDTRAARAGFSPGTAPSSAASARTPRGGPARRSSRGRSSTNLNPPKPTDPSRPRALTSLITKSMAEKKNRALEITPLSALVAPIGAPLTQLSTPMPPEHSIPARPLPAFDSATIRSLLANTSKLREVAILSELLQPPRALRPYRRPR
jgi:hypothetical protein